MVMDDRFMAFAPLQLSELRACGVRLSTLKIYRSALNNFSAFLGTDLCKGVYESELAAQGVDGAPQGWDVADLRLCDITGPLMSAFEGYLRGRGLKPGTVSSYLCRLRALYNRGVQKGLCEQTYPFRGVYTSIPKTSKRALPVDVLVALMELDLSKKPKLAKARDFFLFSFAACGMAFADIVYMRKENLVDGYLKYERRKSGAHVEVRGTPYMQEVIDRYGDPSSPYLFPFLHSLDEEECERERIRWINWFNRQLHRLGQMLPIPMDLTSYMARHSWGTRAHDMSVDMSVISCSMGHSSEHTTQIYLDSMNHKPLDDANDRVTGFLWKGADAVHETVEEQDPKQLMKSCLRECLEEILQHFPKKSLLQMLRSLLQECLGETVGKDVSGSTGSKPPKVEPPKVKPPKVKPRGMKPVNEEKRRVLDKGSKNKDNSKNANNNNSNNNNNNSHNTTMNKRNNNCKAKEKVGQLKQGLKASNLLQKKRENRHLDKCRFLCKKSSKSAANLENKSKTTKFSAKK